MKQNQLIIAFIVVLTVICSTTATSLPKPERARAAQCSNIRNVDRFDCYPEQGSNQQTCEARGCCWSPPTVRPFTDVPYCYFPTNYGGYRYVNVSKTDSGLIAYMTRTFKSPYPEDVQNLRMIVKYESEDRLHVKIVDAEHDRYESLFPEIQPASKETGNAKYKIEIDEQRTGFRVIRKSDDTILFDAMDMGGFIYANQYLQISARLPSDIVYGLAEHTTRLRQSTNWNRITLFNNDQLPTENMALYGSHPMYINVDSVGNAYGMFLLNSNAMDVVLQDSPAITFRTIGGVLDMYFLMGPTPADVVRQYTTTVGKSAMPPMWGLGFHLCKYGYKTLDRTRFIMQRNLDAGIPLDVQWNDLDYMERNNQFTYDKVTFKELPEFVKGLHEKGMHYIPLIDPGVSGSEKPGSYPPYDKGLEMNIFVLNSSDLPFFGKVWNSNSTVWPDFTNPLTYEYWSLMFKSMHDMFEYDGAWIDMNEPSNFLDGSSNGCPDNVYDSPPYTPGVNGGLLKHKTLCMSAKHHAGIHYNIHNLFGISEANMTRGALSEMRGKRPFIISRSTFLGFGRYAGHWSGDVLSNWNELKLSIPQMLTFSILGVPLMGADICGFAGNTTAALCQRWMQLGAFYPFSRNHNADGSIDQDPAAFGEEVIASSIKALQIRYSLLPYLYTLFYKAHVYGDTVARPLSLEFPHDPSTYSIDDQFLWGSSFMICPVVEEGKTSRWLYLPSSKWYDVHTSKSQSRGNNGWIEVNAPSDTIPLYFRGGSVLPMQQPAQNTYLQRNNSIELLAALDGNGEAEGQLFWDDGDSLDTVEKKQYTLINFKLKTNELTSNVEQSSEEVPPALGRVAILGIEQHVKFVTVNGENTSFEYSIVGQYLVIEDLKVSLMEPVSVKWE